MAETDWAGSNEQLTEVEFEEKPYRDKTSAFCEIRKRELGLSQSTDFSRRAGGSEVDFHFSFFFSCVSVSS